jgi:DHA2 family multidrug resistance protein
LYDRNILLIGASLFGLRFVLLDMVLLAPGFLAAVQGYRALETGRVLSWLVWSVLIAGSLAASLMKRVQPRWIAALGFSLVALGSMANARVTDVWTAESFERPQAIAAMGFAFLFVGVLGMAAQHIAALGTPAPLDVLALSAFFQLVRIFGGQCGSSLMQHLLVVRTRYHVNVLNWHVDAGAFLTEERLRLLTGAQLADAAGLEDAQQRAGALLGAQLGKQAIVLAYSDGFSFVAWLCALGVVMLAAMRPVRNYFSPAVLKSIS